MKAAVKFKFEIYVAQNAINSVQAVTNLRAICKEHLPDAYEIVVVDVFDQPQRALAEKVFMTPTLVVVEPAPVRRLVGNLSETKTVLRALGLESPAT